MLLGCIHVCTREQEEQCVIDMIAFPGEWHRLTPFHECVSCSVKNKILCCNGLQLFIHLSVFEFSR